jgi:hypothetical protein
VQAQGAPASGVDVSLPAGTIELRHFETHRLDGQAFWRRNRFMGDEFRK